MKVLLLTIFLTSFHLVKPACMSKEALALFGFELADPVAETTEDHMCGKINSCVKVENIEGKIKGQMNRCKGKRKEQKEKKVKEMSESGESYKNIAKGNGKGQKGKPKRDKVKDPSEEQMALMDRAAEKCGEDDANCTKLAEELEKPEKSDDCRKAVNEAMVGIYCTFISDKASDHFTFDSANSAITSTLKADNATKIAEVCYAEFSAKCDIINIESIAETLDEDGSTARKGKGLKCQKACEKIIVLDECKDNISGCSASVVEEFVSAFVTFGKSCGNDNPDGDDSKRKDNLKNVGDKSKPEEASASRLLEASEGRVLEEEATATGDCTATFSSSGLDAIAIGAASGIDFSKYKGAWVLSSGLISILMILIK